MSLRVIDNARVLFKRLNANPSFRFSVLNDIPLDKEVYKQVKIAFIYVVCIKRAEDETLETYWKSVAPSSMSILTAVRKFRTKYGDGAFETLISEEDAIINGIVRAVILPSTSDANQDIVAALLRRGLNH